MSKKSLIIVFTGDGKGKTTAALGVAMRMAGWGKKVVYCTFFKKSFSGEFKVLKKLRGSKILMFCCKYPSFSQDMTKKEFRKYFLAEWERFLNKISVISGYDLIVLDEILISIRDKLLKDTDIISFIDMLTEKIPEINIILTGRGATPSIIKMADIVTEMHCIKHPYPEILARKGIDF